MRRQWLYNIHCTFPPQEKFKTEIGAKEQELQSLRRSTEEEIKQLQTKHSEKEVVTSSGDCRNPCILPKLL